VDDHLRCDPSNNRTTKRGPYAVTDIARGYCRCRLKNVARCCFLGTGMFSRFQRPWIRLCLTCQSRSNGCPSIRSAPKRGRCLVTARISPSNRGSSCGRCDWYRWVLRSGSSTRHARRSETFWGSKRQRTSAIVRRQRSGLTVSLHGFLQHLHVENLLVHHLLQPDNLFLQGFELLRHLRLQPVVLRWHRGTRAVLRKAQEEWKAVGMLREMSTSHLPKKGKTTRRPALSLWRLFRPNYGSHSQDAGLQDRQSTLV